MTINVIPWVLAGIAAVWFGLLAARARKNWELSSLAGGLFGLVSSTCVFGLGHAMAIPFSDRERAALHIEWTVGAIAPIVIVGVLFTWAIRRNTGPRDVETPQPGVVGDKKPGKAAA